MEIPDTFAAGFAEERQRAMAKNSIDSVAAAQVCLGKMAETLGRLDKLTMRVHNLETENKLLKDHLEKARKAFVEMQSQILVDKGKSG